MDSQAAGVSFAICSSIRPMRTVLALALLVAGCGDDDATQAPTPSAPAEPPSPPPTFHPEDELYDAEGNLRESDEVVAGLHLPRGLELDREEERRHIYKTHVPIAKVVAYFGPRLFTGLVDRIGDGAVYRGATVVGVENAPRMDVSILQAGSSVRVEILELPPLPVAPPSPAELQRQWDEMMRRAE